MDIIGKADEIIKRKPLTITDHPCPMSNGTIHDYYSNGSYWWPNPDTQDHLPYIRRDGLLNPENFVEHKNLILRLSLDASVLYRAWKMTGEGKYASMLVRDLVSFFVDEKTRMNPSLRYSQAIPGVCEGRSIGLIDTLQLIDIPVLALDLRKEGAIDESAYSGLSGWFSEYSKWLIESDFGKTESQERNNHSVTYYAELASFSILSERRDEIHASIRKAFKERLIRQMGEDGLFPEELRRTRAFGYSMFVVDNLAAVATLASRKDDNLWTYNGLMGKAVDAMLPYVLDKASWPFGEDVEMWDTMPSKSTYLYLASYALGDPRYMDAYSNLKDPDYGRPAEARHIPIKTPEAYLPFLASLSH